MKIRDVFLAVITIVEDWESSNPARKVQIEGETLSPKQITKALNKLLGWLYKDLTADSIERVVHCYDCRHYKKYKRRTGKGDTFYACELNKQERQPNFYCKDGSYK